jgi:hypothetical protein
VHQNRLAGLDLFFDTAQATAAAQKMAIAMHFVVHG